MLDSQNTEEQAVKLASKYLPAVPKHQDLPPNHQRSEPPRPAPRAAGAAQQKQSAANGTAAPAAVPVREDLGGLLPCNFTCFQCSCQMDVLFSCIRPER